MGILRKIAYAFLGLFLAFMGIIMFTIYTTIHNTPQAGKPYLVKDEPAGIYYTGPATTAVAGYYCVVALNATPLPGPMGLQVPVGYSIQLNAQLSSGWWVQDVMGTGQCSGSCPSYVWDYASEYWLGINTTTGNAVTLPGPAACGWLVIAVVNGTAYTGYSLDGRSVTWFSRYVVGNATIVPDLRTDLVLAGPSFSEGLNITKALTYLAMYYWDGTTWRPAPVGVLYMGGTGEWVEEAWVFTNGKACGVVSWPEPINTTECPPPPSFSPYPG